MDSEKIGSNLTAILPKIMGKNVQILYSGYGREVNGKKKRDFSTTETCKCLKGTSFLYV